MRPSILLWWKWCYCDKIMHAIVALLHNLIHYTITKSRCDCISSLHCYKVHPLLAYIKRCFSHIQSAWQTLVSQEDIMLKLMRQWVLGDCHEYVMSHRKIFLIELFFWYPPPPPPPHTHTHTHTHNIPHKLAINGHSYNNHTVFRTAIEFMFWNNDWWNINQTLVRAPLLRELQEYMTTRWINK